MSLVSGLLSLITSIGSDISNHEDRIAALEASGGASGDKISELAALTGANLAAGDLFAVADVSATETKNMTSAELLDYLRRNGFPRVKRLNSQHSISSTTGTEITDLQLTLEAGTYVFDYYLIVRSATATVGPMIGINFTGTAAVKTMLAFWADGSGSLLAETHNMDDQGVLSSGFISGMANKAYSTTAPNMGTTVGVTTTASDIPMRITGVLIVTAAGDLECWHSSETATATSVEVGSSVAVVRTA